MNEDRTLLRVTAALLAAGAGIDRLSRALTIAALVALLLLPASFGLPPAASTGIIAVVALLGLVETHYALRIGFDRVLFAHLAEDPDLTGLDGVLLGLGLVPAAKTGRPPAERARGARRLLNRQALCLLAQAALVLAGAGLAVTGGGR